VASEPLAFVVRVAAKRIDLPVEPGRPLIGITGRSKRARQAISIRSSSAANKLPDDFKQR